MNNGAIFLTVKALDRNDGGRWLVGTATSAATDRMGDIVRPDGAKYQMPLVLLFAHDHAKPIGSVTEARTTNGKIVVKAKLAEGAKDANEVWSLLQAGVPLALSIGFRALETKPLSGGGIEFTSWDWYELSVVSVPANSDAQISHVGKCLAVRAEEPEVPVQRAARGEPAPFDPEAFGSAIGDLMMRQLGPIKERLAKLEGQMEASR